MQESPNANLIQSGRCGCEYNTKYCVAEKEFSTCSNSSANTDCIALYQSIKNQSTFALESHNQTELSIGQQNKIKMGGLLGLQTIVLNHDSPNIDNIHALNQAVKQRYQGFSNLPFSQLMPSIASFKFRQKRTLKQSQKNDDL